MDFAAGGSYINTNSTKNLSLAVPELRAFQEMSLTKPLGKWQGQFRYRLDERFIHNNDRVVLTEGYRFSLRHRFRFQFYRVIKKISDTKSLALRLSEEIMLHTGNVPHTFDQNRIFASLEYRFNKRWSIESGYLNLYQARTDNGYFDRHIIRFTVHHKLDFSSAE